MGTSNAATLRALAVAREAAAQADLLADIRTEAQRAANNSQFLVDELMGPVVSPEPEPETAAETPQPDKDAEADEQAASFRSPPPTPT